MCERAWRERAVRAYPKPSSPADTLLQEPSKGRPERHGLWQPGCILLLCMYKVLLIENARFPKVMGNMVF